MASNEGEPRKKKEKSKGRIDRYVKVKRLGSGTYGRVYLVRHEVKNELFVIKEVELSQLEDHQKQQAVKEIRFLNSLCHPNIIAYEEFFKVKYKGRTLLYIAMEYAGGGDLAHVIEKYKEAKQRIPEQQIVDWFVQLCLALKHCHDRKIIHRDLKSENIFLSEKGRVKLGDFGVARDLEQTYSEVKTQVGTPFYLSPEVCQNAPYASKADIWGVGAIMYELCALEHPFEAKSLNELVDKILNTQQPPLSRTYSKELRQAIDLCLMKDPANRPRVSELLELPLLKREIPRFLDQEIIEDEFSHTVLHGQVHLAGFVKQSAQAQAPALAHGHEETTASDTSSASSATSPSSNSSTPGPPSPQHRSTSDIKHNDILTAQTAQPTSLHISHTSAPHRAIGPPGGPVPLPLASGKPVPESKHEVLRQPRQPKPPPRTNTPPRTHSHARRERGRDSARGNSGHTQMRRSMSRDDLNSYLAREREQKHSRGGRPDRGFSDPRYTQGGRAPSSSSHLAVSRPRNRPSSAQELGPVRQVRTKSSRQLVDGPEDHMIGHQDYHSDRYRSPSRQYSRGEIKDTEHHTCERCQTHRPHESYYACDVCASFYLCYTCLAFSRHNPSHSFQPIGGAPAVASLCGRPPVSPRTKQMRGQSARRSSSRAGQRSTHGYAKHRGYGDDLSSHDRDVARTISGGRSDGDASTARVQRSRERVSRTRDPRSQSRESDRDRETLTQKPRHDRARSTQVPYQHKGEVAMGYVPDPRSLHPHPPRGDGERSHRSRTPVRDRDRDPRLSHNLHERKRLDALEKIRQENIRDRAAAEQRRRQMFQASRS